MKTMKKSYYFSHDSNARNDEKVVRLRMRHGAKGYGIYFMLVEMLRESETYTLIKDYEMLAFEIREDPAAIQSVVEDFGLFATTDDGGRIYSPSLAERMRAMEESKGKLSRAGRSGMSKRYNKNEENANKVITYDSENANDVITNDSERPNDVITNDSKRPNDVITTGNKRPNDVITNDSKKHNDVITNGGGEPNDVITNDPQKPNDVITNKNKNKNKNKIFVADEYSARLREFFDEKNAIAIDGFCMSNRVSRDEFYAACEEVVNEWRLSMRKHRDYTDMADHLLNQARIKIQIRKKDEKAGKDRRPDNLDGSQPQDYSSGF